MNHLQCVSKSHTMLVAITLSVVAFQALILTGVHSTTPESHHDYCIVGAGPGGLQLGYYMERAKRDYVIFERSNVSGSFYVKYPRHRTLISINKRNTGQSNKEYNMRHDWNSLLSDNDNLLFGKYTKEMFPSADYLLDYLRDYQQKLGINVQFNTNISNVHRVPNDKVKEGHVYHMNDQNGKLYSCRTLVLATGIGTPIIPDIPGIEYAQGYEDFSVNPEDYEGKTVLILGRGNAAFETATAIYGSTNLVHMIARSRARLAWATHYVGDLRAVNNALLDTYQLKSLDAVLEAALDKNTKFIKEGDKISLDVSDEEQEKRVNDSLSLPQKGPNFEITDNFALREKYDIILRCLGFKFDDTIFQNNSALIKLRGRKKKYPAIYHNYESADFPGMFIAGTASHSLDHRKSAGGFIHGYRYTARALHRILEWRFEGVPWPSTTAPVTQLVSHILKRINEASGFYQMFSVLGDVIVFKNDTLEYQYFEEFPINLIHKFENITGSPAPGKVIVLNLQYGANFSGAGKDIFRSDRATGDASDAHNSNFLHPVFYYYHTLPTYEQMKTKGKKEHLPRPDFQHHIVEDFLTLWNAELTHILPLRRFIEMVTGKDMRNFYADDCFKTAMTHMTLPMTCDQHYSEGQGLRGTSELRKSAALSGLFKY